MRSLIYASGVEGVDAALFGLLCCVISLIGTLIVLGTIAVSMRHK